MIITSLILLILSNAITLRRDKSILYARATIIILLTSVLITYDNLYFLFLSNGIGIFGGLFHTTCITNVFSAKSIRAFMFYLMQYSISNLNAFILIIATGYSLYYYRYKDNQDNEKNNSYKEKNNSYKEQSKLYWFTKSLMLFKSPPLITIESDNYKIPAIAKKANKVECLTQKESITEQTINEINIKKIDSSIFIEKRPIDWVNKWLEKDSIQGNSILDNNKDLIKRLADKADLFLIRHLDKNTNDNLASYALPDNLNYTTDNFYASALLYFAYFFLLLKKCGLLYIIIPAIITASYSLLYKMSNLLFLDNLKKRLSFINRSLRLKHVYNNILKIISKRFIKLNCFRNKNKFNTLKNSKITKAYSSLYTLDKLPLCVIDLTVYMQSMLSPNKGPSLNKGSIPILKNDFVEVSTTQPVHLNFLTHYCVHFFMRPLLESDYPAYLTVYKCDYKDAADYFRYEIIEKNSPSVGVFLNNPNGTEGELIGVVGVINCKESINKWPEVYYFVKEEFRNMGYATRFLKEFLIIWWALPRKNVRIRVQPISLCTLYTDEIKEQLGAEIEISNKASIGVIQKAGFVNCGNYLAGVGEQKQEFSYWKCHYPN